MEVCVGNFCIKRTCIYHVKPCHSRRELHLGLKTLLLQVSNPLWKVGKLLKVIVNYGVSGTKRYMREGRTVKPAF